MQCYHHPQQAAVGVCKNCSKGICLECAVDEGYGLACRQSCTSEVKALWQIIQRNKDVYQKTAAVYLRGAILYALMALIFAFFPYLYPSVGSELRYLFFGMGGVMLVGSIVNLINASRIKKS